jgi:hypothetical protein
VIAPAFTDDALGGAHRLLAYEWDPASGRLVVSGDARELVGVAPAKLATLADPKNPRRLIRALEISNNWKKSQTKISKLWKFSFT